MEDELLIAGIDPGVTAAYAALNTKGELMKLKSGKHLNLSTILTELAQAGRVIVVGTDVKYSPRFVEKFCSRLGAKLVAPKEDMKIGYKKRLTEMHRYNDDHQRDALAAALFAYQEMKPLFKKIDFFLKKEGKEHLSHHMKLLASQGMSIADALHHLEDKKEEIKTKKRFREKVKRSARIIEINRSLLHENIALRGEYKQLQTKLSVINQHMEERINDKIAKTVAIKDRRIAELIASLAHMKQETTNLQTKLNDLTNVLFSTTNKIIIKRVKTLGWDEVEKTVHPGDRIILVDDINTFSERSIDYLKGKVTTIITKTKPSELMKKQPFDIMLAHDLNLDERETFALVDKARLEQEKEKKDMLQKIVKEYQDERNIIL